MMRRGRGFTLVEILIVMAMIGLLLAIALPRYFGSLEHSKEVVLKENLLLMRETLDRYYADRGHFPDSLDVLVEERYLRDVPVDPLTGRADSWVPENSTDQQKPGIANVRSGAPGTARDGSRYDSW